MCLAAQKNLIKFTYLSVKHFLLTKETYILFETIIKNLCYNHLSQKIKGDKTMTILENLYYGNIAPFERKITDGETIDKAIFLEQKALFEAFEKAESEVSCEEEVRAFTAGFKLGVRLIREVFETE